MKQSIEKIMFVRGKKIELTKEEAKELKSILSDLFGEDKIVHEHFSQAGWPYHHWVTDIPFPYWSRPITYGTSTIGNAVSDTAYLTLT